MKSCVIIVENLPVPFDRRVWQEAQALRQAGWRVSVICPKNSQYPESYTVIDEIAIYRHSLPLEARHRFAFVLEYVAALFHEARLLFKVLRERGFDVIQICNPPDILFLNALPYKLIGKKLVFDHHDVCPELFVAKFGRKGWLFQIMLFAEMLTIRSADVVISANETFRKIAMERCRKATQDVVTVYSIPDRRYIRKVAPNLALRQRVRLVLGYVGIISDQDGVDHIVRMLHHLMADHGCREIRVVIVGDGPALAQVRQLANDLALTQHIVFTGYLRGEKLLSALSAFDIGIIPDPVNEYNDKISMNKVFEYTALGLPVVAYNLTETRRLLGECAEYADDTTPAALAQACLRLINDEGLREERGQSGRALAAERFDWEREREKYVAAFERFNDRNHDV